MRGVPFSGGRVNVEANTHAFLAEIYAFVLQTAKILIMPPIARFPVEYDVSNSCYHCRNKPPLVYRYSSQIQINVVVVSDM